MDNNEGPRGGSAMLAGLLGVTLAILGGFMWSGYEIPWKQAKHWIQGGGCLLFGVVLIWWAIGTPWDAHQKKTLHKIGNTTITMVLTVVAGAVAFLTLVDAAAR